MFILVILIYIAYRLLVAWPVMLLVDPATNGAYTISYWQAVCVSALIGLLFPGSFKASDD